jgi:hypothetical protein
MNIALIGPTTKKDIWNIPICFKNAFERTGVNTKLYSTINENAPPGTSQLLQEAWTEDGVRECIEDYNSGVFKADIILHLDFGLFKSKLLTKNTLPNCIWIYEAGDDPQCFSYNYEKIKYGCFDFVITPDIRALNAYKLNGINALWCPHFADATLLDPSIQPTVTSITSRSYNEPFFAQLKQLAGDMFIANDKFIPGHQHLHFLQRGKMVIQNSKYREITRRIFEGMICNRLVIADKPDDETQISKIFTDGEDIVYFTSVEDCYEKINYYNNNELERLRIANNGYKKVLQNHTIDKRVEKLLSVIR